MDGGTDAKTDKKVKSRFLHIATVSDDDDDDAHKAVYLLHYEIFLRNVTVYLCDGRFNMASQS